MVMKVNKNKISSKLSRCRSCGKEVSFRAEMCPNCGDRHPNGSGCGCLIVIAIFLIIVLVMMAKVLSGH